MDDAALEAALSLVDGELAPLWAYDELNVDVDEIFLPDALNWPPSPSSSDPQTPSNFANSDDTNGDAIAKASRGCQGVRDEVELKNDVAVELGRSEIVKKRKKEELAQAKEKTPRTRNAQKRPTNYNPNRARDEQRKELKELRSQSLELEQQLSVLKKLRPAGDEVDHQRSRRRNESSTPVAVGVWKSIAKRQLEKWMASVHENNELKAQVLAGQATIQRMEKLLRSHNIEKATQSACIEQSHRLMQLPRFHLDPSIIRRLEAGVSSCYNELPLVFKNVGRGPEQIASLSDPELLADARGNLFTRVFGAKVFPYDIQTTGRAAWTQFAFSVRPNARCFVDEIVYAKDDLVIGRFATELHMDGSKMVVFGWQAKRRYIEAEREIVVWQSQMDPIEFRGHKICGAAYEEHGFFIMHRPPELPSNFTKLQSCYRVAPSPPIQSSPEDALALNVTEFVLHWMASMIPVNHQIIEDSLFEGSLSSTPRGVV